VEREIRLQSPRSLVHPLQLLPSKMSAHESKERHRSRSRDRSERDREYPRDARKDGASASASSSRHHSDSRRSRSRTRSRSRSRSRSRERQRRDREREKEKLERDRERERERDRNSRQALPFGERTAQAVEERLKKESGASATAGQVLLTPDMDEAAMMAALGLPGNFDTTQGKLVPDGNVAGVRVQSKRQYRQYMNRKGGFNRPLAPSY
jgi:U4/U6.U5 tri-snRNP-associated protein 3